MSEYHISDAPIFDARLGTGGASRAVGPDVCFIEDDIAASGPWMPGPGVTVIGAKSNGEKPIISENALDNSNATSIKPDNVRISNLDLTEGPYIFDPIAFVMEFMRIRETAVDGVRWRGHDRDDISGEMVNCELKDIGEDGVDLHVSGTGSASDVARSVIALKNILAFDNIGRVGQPDQAVTPHDEGMIICDGGVFASNGLTAMGPATAESPLIMRNCKITGKVQGHAIENCEIDAQGEVIILFTNGRFPTGTILDSRIRDVHEIFLQNTQDVDIMRNRIIQDGTANNTLFLGQGTDTTYRFHANVLRGSGLSSNRCIQGNTGSGMVLEWWNNLGVKFGICVDLSSSFWTAADIWNSLWIGTTNKFAQTLSVSTKTGRFNYYDDMPNFGSVQLNFENPDLDAVPIAIAYSRGDVNDGAGHIVSGDGAAAANWRDYDNDDFRPNLPVLGVDLGEAWFKFKDWGDPTMATIPQGGDVFGHPFGTNCAGPFSCQDPRFREVLRSALLGQV